MKRIFIPLLICVVIIVGFVMVVAGQEREITEKEFWTRQQVPVDKLPNHAYRVVMIQELFRESDGSKWSTNTSTLEMIWGFRHRILTKAVTAHGTKVNEIVGTKSWVYERNDGGDWKRTRSAKLSLTDTEPATETPDPDVKARCKYIGKAVLDGKPLDLYEMVMNQRFGTGEKGWASTYTSRIWVNDGGFPIKYVTEVKRGDSFIASRSTSLYDYVTPISIEVPKLKVTNKRAARRKQRK